MCLFFVVLVFEVRRNKLVALVMVVSIGLLYKYCTGTVGCILRLLVTAHISSIIPAQVPVYERAVQYTPLTYLPHGASVSQAWLEQLEHD
jgi:hypothetical protein